MIVPDQAFWSSRVFPTGHRAFKGGRLPIWLRLLGAEVYGYALAPDTSPALFEAAAIDGLLQSDFADINELSRPNAAVAAFGSSIVWFKPPP